MTFGDTWCLLVSISPAPPSGWLERVRSPSRAGLPGWWSDKSEGSRVPATAAFGRTKTNRPARPAHQPRGAACETHGRRVVAHETVCRALEAESDARSSGDAGRKVAEAGASEAGHHGGVRGPLWGGGPARTDGLGASGTRARASHRSGQLRFAKVDTYVHMRCSG